MNANSFTFVIVAEVKVPVTKVADADVVKTLDMTGGATPSPMF